MCNAHVAQTVRERIEKEGLPSVSRRSFLRDRQHPRRRRRFRAAGGPC